MRYKFPAADGYSSPGLAPASVDIMSIAPATGCWGAGHHPSAVGEPAKDCVVYIPMLPDELLDDIPQLGSLEAKASVFCLTFDITLMHVLSRVVQTKPSQYVGFPSLIFVC